MQGKLETRAISRHAPQFAMFLLLALLLSCDTPGSITRFCSSAVVSLRAGDALFDDMKESCIREAESRESFGAFTVADDHPAACDDIGNQAEGLKAASKVLSNYFTALNDLASFGSSKAGDDATHLAATVTTHASLGAAPQKAVASVAGFLTRVATAGYQHKHLADDIVKVHEDIKVALDGLGESAAVVYLHQLQDEEKKTATRYREFLVQHPGAAEVILVLDSRWQSDRALFAAKRKAALSYQAALDTLAKGNEELAAHARGLRARELPALLGPYTAHLESLAPAIQKAFSGD